MLQQESERHRQGLIPLGEFSFRHRRQFYGIPQHRIADTAGLSRRRASLIERQLIEPSAEEAERLQGALESLIAETARRATP